MQQVAIFEEIVKFMACMFSDSVISYCPSRVYVSDWISGIVMRGNINLH
jgi:hypothetical protein